MLKPSISSLHNLHQLLHAICIEKSLTNFADPVSEAGRSNLSKLLVIILGFSNDVGIVSINCMAM